MEYFYWLRVKNSNHLHTELSLDYSKDTKFYLKSKASFMHISSIASFKPFLIALVKIHPVWNYFAKKKSCPTIKFFPSSNIFFVRLFLANTKKIGGHRARLIEKEHLFHYRA